MKEITKPVENKKNKFSRSSYGKIQVYESQIEKKLL